MFGEDQEVDFSQLPTQKYSVWPLRLEKSPDYEQSHPRSLLIHSASLECLQSAIVTIEKSYHLTIFILELFFFFKSAYYMCWDSCGFFSEIVKFLTLMSFCLRSSSEGPVSTVVIGSLISDTISARTGTRLEEWDLILHRGSMMYFTRLWLTWSMISISWRRLSTALLKVQSAKHLNVKSKGKLYYNLLNNTCR